MDLLLIFFLLGLVLQGLKVLVNHLLAGVNDFEEDILHRSTGIEHVNLLSVPSLGQKHIERNHIRSTSGKGIQSTEVLVHSTANPEPKGKEVFMAVPIHQSA
jgi:hypothetical protein